jgi:DNA-binding transcriptional LysR family regulator
MDVLRTFVTIADTGSFTKAAEELQLTQSAISLQMKRLQQLIGGNVFVKSPLGQSLTERGKYLDTYARRILTLNDQILAFSGTASQGPTVRVGVQNSFAENFLPDVIKKCNEADRSVQVQFVCDSASNLWGQVAAGYLDMALVLAPFMHSSAAYMEWKEQLVWTCAPKKSIPPGQPIPLIVLPQGFIDSRAIEILEQKSAPYRIVFHTSDMTARKAAVLAGIGLMVMPERCVPSELAIAKAPHLPELPQTRCGIFIKEGLHIKQTKKIIEAFVEAVAPALPPS